MGGTPTRLPSYIKLEDISDYRGLESYLIYVTGSIYKAIDQNNGKVVISHTSADDVFNYCIGQIQNSGVLRLKSGLYKVDAAIDTGEKSISIIGEGLGKTNLPYAYPGTVIQDLTSAYADYILKMGGDGSSTCGMRIENLTINGRQHTNPLGAIKLNNCLNAIIENVHIVDFFNTTADQGSGIYLYGDVLCWQNQIRNCHIRRCHYGIMLKSICTGTVILGGRTEGRAATETIGLYIDGASSAQILGGFNNESHAHSSGKAVYIKSGHNHRFFGLKCEGNYNDITIDPGTGTGNNHFFSPHLASLVAGGTSIVNNGGLKSWFYNGPGLSIMNRGSASITNGVGTVAVTHNLYVPAAGGGNLKVVPTTIKVLPTTAGEMATVGTIGDTTFTITVKKHDNTNGSNQTVYWEANYDP